MIPVEEFKSENQEIRDLCEILGVTVDKHRLRNNAVACELMDRFADRVCAHLEHQVRSIYRDLLRKQTHEADMIADKFLSNTQQLKRIFDSYKRGWCGKSHNENAYVKYAAESKEMFKLVYDRINFEEQKIFPHFE